MGPSGFLPSSNDPDLGNISLDEIEDAFYYQAQGLIMGGCDALLIETGQDILEIKTAIEGCFRAMEKLEKMHSVDFKCYSGSIWKNAFRNKHSISICDS